MRAKLVVLLLGVCLLLNAQPPIQKFWALNQCNLLIAKLPVKPSAAYSLRKLSCTYTGPAIQVRINDKNNTTKDINFLSDGNLDTDALFSLCNIGKKKYSGYVITWYDQSGNGRNVSQLTADQQPRIVNNGVIETSNGRPSVRFINENSTILYAAISPSTLFTSGYIGTASLVLESSNLSHTSALGYSSTGDQRYRWQAHMDENNVLDFDVTNAAATNWQRLSYSNSLNEGSLQTYALVASNVSPFQNIYISGSSVATNTTNALSKANSTNFQIGGIAEFTDYYHDGHISEVMIFNTALSSSIISVINTNQKKYYGITP